MVAAAVNLSSVPKCSGTVPKSPEWVPRCAGTGAHVRRNRCPRASGTAAQVSPEWVPRWLRNTHTVQEDRVEVRVQSQVRRGALHDRDRAALGHSAGVREGRGAGGVEREHGLDEDAGERA